MCARRISLGLLINAGMLLVSSRRYNFGRSRDNWEEFVQCQVRANETNSEVNCISLVSETGDFLMIGPSPHKWWSTLKSAVFSLSLSLQTLVGGGGGLVC